MPQIGWFEILVVILLAIIILGPKDFPVVIRKIGNWTGSVKKYFNEIQKDVSELHENIENEISMDKNIKDKFEDKKKKDE